MVWIDDFFGEYKIKCRKTGGLNNWWQRVDLNYRPRAYESPALPLSYAATKDVL